MNLLLLGTLLLFFNASYGNKASPSPSGIVAGTVASVRRIDDEKAVAETKKDVARAYSDNIPKDFIPPSSSSLAAKKGEVHRKVEIIENLLRNPKQAEVDLKLGKSGNQMVKKLAEKMDAEIKNKNVLKNLKDSSSNNVENTFVSSETLESSVFTKFDKDGKRVLTFYGLMLAGAVARSASATAVHPLNVIKTMLQTKEGNFPELKWSILSRGAGSQFIMSVPHGALNFVVTETTKQQLDKITSESKYCQKVPKNILNPTLDFFSSAVSTFLCSVVSTPQMVLTDRIMAGIYPNLFAAISAIAKKEGIKGFYKGWCPALVQKIPSYALTWMFFQQIKLSFINLMGRAGTTVENTIMGSVAAAGACCVMIPMDTIKTRIVMQRDDVIYKGMIDCFQQIIKNEGVGSLYRALPPRLLAVVPMIGIQFAVYELMKRSLVGLPPPKKEKERNDAISTFSSTRMATPTKSK